jgi:thioredoxin 1
MSTFFIIVFAVLFGFMILSQVWIRSRAKALEGKPLPALPGRLGKALASEKSALLYFMSPQCGACRPWTARFSEMSKRNAHVHVINVAQELEIARALGVMATPSTLVVKDGRIQSYHVGGVPSDVIAQFA